MFKNILVCADGSEQAMEAAKAATELAKKFGSSIRIVNIFDIIASVAPYMGVWDLAVGEDTITKYAQEAQQTSAKRTGEIFHKEDLPFEVSLDWGRPADKIIEIAKDNNSDLIVMGSRGLGGIKSLLLGSVSDNVLHHAHCPVLIIR